MLATTAPSSRVICLLWLAAFIVCTCKPAHGASASFSAGDLLKASGACAASADSPKRCPRTALLQYAKSVSGADVQGASTKRGLALDAVPKANRSSHTVCKSLRLFATLHPWWHSWQAWPPEDLPCHGSNASDGFIPMLYGKNWTEHDWPNVWSPADAILGFHAPNSLGDTRINATEAAVEWWKVEEAAQRLHIPRIGSPVASACNNNPASCYTDLTGWLDEFFESCQNCTVDFVPTRLDTCSATELWSFLDGLWNRYRKPIWLIDIHCTPSYGPSPVDGTAILDFMRQALPLLEALPYVERYAWSFKLGQGHVGRGLLNSDLSLTTLGVFYRDYRFEPMDCQAQGGVGYNNFCFFKGDNNESCEDVCDRSGAVYSDVGSNALAPSAAPFSREFYPEQNDSYWQGGALNWPCADVLSMLECRHIVASSGEVTSGPTSAGVHPVMTSGVGCAKGPSYTRALDGSKMHTHSVSLQRVCACGYCVGESCSFPKRCLPVASSPNYDKVVAMARVRSSSAQSRQPDKESDKAIRSLATSAHQLHIDVSVAIVFSLLRWFPYVW